MLRALHVYPVTRTGVDIEAIKWAQAILTKGHVLLIFPEGTRKKINRWKTGFLRIAKTTQSKILFISIDAPSKTIKIASTLFTPTEDKENDLEFEILGLLAICYKEKKFFLKSLKIYKKSLLRFKKNFITYSKIGNFFF